MSTVGHFKSLCKISLAKVKGVIIYLLQEGKRHFKTAERAELFLHRWCRNFKLFYEAFSTCHSQANHNHRGVEGKNEVKSIKGRCKGTFTPPSFGLRIQTS